MSRPSLGVVNIPAQWDARDVKSCFDVRARNYQWGSHQFWGCFWGNGRRLSGCTILTTTCLQKDFFLTGEEDGTICRIVWIEILSQLWWGMMCILLGVYHTLMQNDILQHGWRGLLHVLLWGLRRGRQCWRMW
jgi:hypothetical protein